MPKYSPKLPAVHTSPQKIIFIVGPTGAGKTELGAKLAGLLPVEFISVDSMQIYRGLDIATDKLPAESRRLCPYHLIDILEPDAEYNAADYCRAAVSAARKILEKNKTPVFIGGTGLYVNSLLYGIFEGAAKNASAREALETQAKELGLQALYERLKRVDPQAAAKINPADSRRVVRALEVFEFTGRPISELQKERRGLLAAYKVYLFALRRERQDLYRRIDRRVDFMINSGLLNEVKGLLGRGLGRTASACIGIKEMKGFLAGEYDFAEAVRLMKRNSRRFAKRQETWFNKLKSARWIDIKEDAALDKAAGRIYTEWKRPY